MSTYTKRLAARDGEHDGLCFSVSKPFVPHLLDAELTKAHNWRKDSGLVVEGNPAQASEDSPVVVWVLRDDADTNTVRHAVTAHQEVEEVTDPLTLLQDKVSAGESFTEDEMQTAIRLLLTRG